MGYDLHITRRSDWSGDGPEIPLSEWQAYVEACPDMRMDSFAEAKFPDGAILRVEEPGIAVWTTYSRNDIGGGWAWFHHRRGNIVVKDPDAEIRRRMFVVAQQFGARVQGDDGEFYNDLGDVEKKRWWKRA